MTYQESLEYEALLRDFAAGKVSPEDVRRRTPKSVPSETPADPNLVDSSEVGTWQTIDVEMHLLAKGILTQEMLDRLTAH